MEKKKWQTKIKKACKDAGTYEPCFDAPIAALAEILEKADEAKADYEASGASPVVEHTNKAGATNITKNPALMVWLELEKTALTYWRDLGLTPAGLKKIKGEKQTQVKSTLADALASLET